MSRSLTDLLSERSVRAGLPTEMPRNGPEYDISMTNNEPNSMLIGKLSIVPIPV